MKWIVVPVPASAYSFTNGWSSVVTMRERCPSFRLLIKSFVPTRSVLFLYYLTARLTSLLDSYRLPFDVMILTTYILYSLLDSHKHWYWYDSELPVEVFQIVGGLFICLLIPVLPSSTNSLFALAFWGCLILTSILLFLMQRLEAPLRFRVWLWLERLITCSAPHNAPILIYWHTLFDSSATVCIQQGLGVRCYRHKRNSKLE